MSNVLTVKTSVTCSASISSTSAFPGTFVCSTVSMPHSSGRRLSSFLAIISIEDGHVSDPATK